MTNALPQRARNRPLRLLLALVTALLLPLVPATPAAAGDDHEHEAPAEPDPDRSSDYEQVVDITFPMSAAAQPYFFDDYDACRSGCARNHQATDLMVPLGTPVYAARGGTIAWLSGSEIGPASYGWMIRIAGDDGRSYAYVHLGEQDGPRHEAYAPGVVEGATVERGQLIGWAGCSGSASCGGGEHLHFEIHDEFVIDPYDYHDHERINPYWSLLDARERGDFGGRGSFTDVAPGSTHEADVEALADSGITKGCGNGRFCPKKPVTREQMASFLVRALDLDVPEEPAGFDDVAEDSLHGRDIAALAASGITRGCLEGRFCPEQPVTRQQMASFLVRALELDRPAEDLVAVFGDVAGDNVHAADIAALASSGITRGCGASSFCPEKPVTREQMASFLVRALEL